MRLAKERTENAARIWEWQRWRGCAIGFRNVDEDCGRFEQWMIVSGAGGWAVVTKCRRFVFLEVRPRPVRRYRDFPT